MIQEVITELDITIGDVGGIIFLFSLNQTTFCEKVTALLQSVISLWCFMTRFFNLQQQCVSKISYLDHMITTKPFL